MSEEVILSELKQLGLQDIYIIRLQMYVSIKPNIAICCLINDIIMNFNSTQEIEAHVEKLIERLLNIYFA